MENENAPIIYMDFTIVQRDLFLGSLKLARFRILVGLGIVASLTLGMIWFFAMIDEQHVLLEVSPLFVGLPFVGIMGQVLRIHAACRKYVRGLPESQRRVQYMFLANTDGYDITWGGSFGHILWQDLLKVVEHPNYFLFYLNRFDIRILPKRGFHQSSDIPTFRGILQSKLGNNARLLTS
jgi:YcxB-like protein